MPSEEVSCGGCEMVCETTCIGICAGNCVGTATTNTLVSSCKKITVPITTKTVIRGTNTSYTVKNKR